MILLAQISHGITVAEWAASVLVQTTAVILFAAMVAHVLLRRSPAGRHAVWLGALVYVLASPLLAYTSRGAGFSWLTIPVIPTKVTEQPAIVAPTEAAPASAVPDDQPLSVSMLARGTVDVEPDPGHQVPNPTADAEFDVRAENDRLESRVTQNIQTKLPQPDPRRSSPINREPADRQSGPRVNNTAVSVRIDSEWGTRSRSKLAQEGVARSVAEQSAFAHVPGLPSAELRSPAASSGRSGRDDGAESLVAGKPRSELPDSGDQQVSLTVGGGVLHSRGLSSSATVASERPSHGARPFSSYGLLAGSVLAIWALGVAFLAVRLLHGWTTLRALRRSARPLAGYEWHELLKRVCKTLDVDALPPIAASAKVVSPMATGVLKPVVLLPQNALQTLDSDGLHDVLVHECAHVLRRDHLVGLAQRLAEMLFWPHPLVHYLNRELSRAREEVCDNYVLRRGDAPRYARTLLELAEQFQVFRSPAAVGLMTPRWKLEQRVAGLLNTRRNRMAHASKRTTTGIAAGLAILGIALMGVRFVSATEDESPAVEKSSSEKEAVLAPASESTEESNGDAETAEGKDEADRENAKAEVKTDRKQNTVEKKIKVEKKRRVRAEGLELEKRIRERVEREIRPRIAKLEKEIDLGLEIDADAGLDEELESTLEKIEEILERDLEPALEKLAETIERDLEAALEGLGEDLERDLKPALKKLGADFQRDFAEAFKNFGANFQRELKPALEKLGKDLEGDLKPALENLGVEIERELKPALEGLSEEVLEAVESELEELRIEFESGAPAPAPVPDAPKVEPGAAPEPPGVAVPPSIAPQAAPQPAAAPKPVAVPRLALVAKTEAGEESKRSQNANEMPEFENRVEKTFAAKDGGLLTVEVDRGHVEVVAVDGRDVTIEVVRKVRANSEEEADAIFDHHEVEFGSSDGDVQVTAKVNVKKQTGIEIPELQGHDSEEEAQKALKKLLNRRFRGISFKLKVPHRYNVNLKTSGGHISVSDLNGEVRTQTAGGHLALGNITGTVWARTAGGHIKLAGGGGSADVRTAGGHTNIGDVNGEVIARTSGGHVNIGRAQGKVVAKTSGGHINIEEVPGQVEAATSGGNVNVTITQQPQADCTVSTSGGNVTVRLADGVRATIDAKTSSGRVHSGLSIQPQGRSKKTLSGDLNGGGPKLAVSTSGGNVRLSLIRETASASDQ